MSRSLWAIQAEDLRIVLMRWRRKERDQAKDAKPSLDDGFPAEKVPWEALGSLDHPSKCRMPLYLTWPEPRDRRVGVDARMLKLVNDGEGAIPPPHPLTSWA